MVIGLPAVQPVSGVAILTPHLPSIAPQRSSARNVVAAMHASALLVPQPHRYHRRHHRPTTNVTSKKDCGLIAVIRASHRVSVKTAVAVGSLQETTAIILGASTRVLTHVRHRLQHLVRLRHFRRIRWVSRRCQSVQTTSSLSLAIGVGMELLVNGRWHK